MIVTIGIRGAARELRLNLNLSAEEIHRLISLSLSEGTPLRLVEENGDEVIIPPRALGYVQIAEEKVRAIGFTVA